MIDRDIKYIFIHIPKTAGTSVTTWLQRNTDAPLPRDDPARRHIYASVYKDYLRGIKFNNAFKFAFVRNPYDRVVSRYLYGKKLGARLDDPDKSWRSPAERAHAMRYKDFYTNNDVRSFADYIQCITSNLSPREWMYRVVENDHMWKYVLSKTDKLLVDFIAKFENIETDFKYIVNELGLPYTPLPKINVSSGRDKYTTYYDNSTVELVTQLYSKDIELFGYEY